MLESGKKKKKDQKPSGHLDWQSGLMNMVNYHCNSKFPYKPAQQGFVAPSELNKKKESDKK